MVSGSGGFRGGWGFGDTHEPSWSQNYFIVMENFPIMYIRFTESK